MPLSTLFRSVSPARLMGRAASNDSRPAVAQEEDLPPSNIPELECEPFGNFYEEHIRFLEFYSKIGYSVNGLSQLLHNSMADNSTSGPHPIATGRSRDATPRRETILECAKLMKEIVLVFKTIHAHVEAKTNSVKKDVRRYDPVRQFTSLRDLDQHLLEEFFNREAETANQRQMQRQSGSPATAMATGEDRRSTQTGSGPQTNRLNAPPPVPRGAGSAPRGESGVSQSAEPPSDEDPTRVSPVTSPRNRNPIGNWSLGRWLPHSRGSSSRRHEFQGLLSDSTEAVDAMNLEPGSRWTGAPARNIRNQQQPQMSPRLETL